MSDRAGGGRQRIVSFEDIVKADTIALGDPESVPVGQYAQEALTNLNLWDEVTPKTSFGTNVTEVLNWVAEGSADAGIVYATDAATTHQVRVVRRPGRQSGRAGYLSGGSGEKLCPTGKRRNCLWSSFRVRKP